MKKIALTVILCITAICAQAQKKHFYMWFDCEANYARLSTTDSISYYLNKVKEIGFTDVVVDIKSIMGEVLYDSQIAPFMGEWEGAYRNQNYDMMRAFITEGHRLGLRVFASLNVFAGGHNYFNRGIVYKQHPQWQSQVYYRDSIIPISKMRWNYNAMLNPANPEVQAYQLSILKEFAKKYDDVDGIIFDRVRFDNITSDFSELSKQLFENYAGIKVDNFPDDILYWQKTKKTEQEINKDKERAAKMKPQSGYFKAEKTSEYKYEWKRGKLFNKWVEWRASVIKSFIIKAHNELKAINPKLILGDYTGAWYPTYYQLGVNWASKNYDASKDYDWATADYKNTGYAELLDVYMTGLYYTLITKSDVDKANGVVGARTEAAMDNSRTYCYSVEGGAELAKKITNNANTLIGSIYVEQYEGNEELFCRAVKQALESTQGVMIFDVSHIINRNWWNLIEIKN